MVRLNRLTLRTLPHALPIGSLFVLGSLLAGSIAAYALGCDRREGVTIAVEFATFGVAYFLTEVPLVALVVWAVRRRGSAGDVAVPLP